MGLAIAPTSTRLKEANGTSFVITGTVSFTARVSNGPRITIMAVVTPDLAGPPLVCERDLKALGVLPRNFPSLCVDVLDVGGLTLGQYEEDECDVYQISMVLVGDPDPLALGIGNDTLAKIKADFADVLVTSVGDAAGSSLGPKMSIELDETCQVKPLHVTTARQVPVHLQPMATKLMRELEKAMAVKRCLEPTTWCAPGHFLLKACGTKVRLSTDFRGVNAAIKRPVHPFNSASDLMRKVLPSAVWFVKLDAVHGYFQVPLDDESSLLTAFLLSDGKWVYLVAPMGLNSSSDEFCIRTDAAMAEFLSKLWLLKIIDAMLIMATTLQEAFACLRLILEKCRSSGIKLSLAKLAVGRPVKFAGFIVADAGIRPDPQKIASLGSFPTPTDKKSLKSCLGLATQLGPFLPDLAHATVNMRALLKKEHAFVWLGLHDAELARAKELLCSSALVKPFDASLATFLLTDASRLHGLGYALIQKEASGRPRLVQCGSCSLTPAQRNYAVVELEASAVLWAVLKCDHFLRGMGNFVVNTDHHPLIGVFTKPLGSMMNDRLQRIRERLLVYSFSLTWTAGKEHLIADALSRAPFFPADPATEVAICAVSEVLDPADPALRLLLEHVDEEYRRCATLWSSGGHARRAWPTTGNCSTAGASSTIWWSPGTGC
jgi:hypothetical protein